MKGINKGDIIVNPYARMMKEGALNPMYVTVYIGDNKSMDYNGDLHTWHEPVEEPDKCRCAWKVIGHVDVDLKGMFKKALKGSKYVPDGDWIPVAKKLPETGEHVRLTCEIKFASGARKRYVCEGYHVGRHEMSATGTSWDDECVEYDEETDESFVAEGWYEVIHNWPEYAAAAISDFVVAWKPMDKPWGD